MEYGKVVIMVALVIVVPWLVILLIPSNIFDQLRPTLDISSLYSLKGISSSSVFQDDVLVYDEYYELKKVLKEASTKEKVVILATLNEAWADPNSIYDIFIKSFKIGENITWILNHLVIIAINEKAYTKCQTTHSHCYLFKSNMSNELAHAATFMTPNYLEIIWERVGLLRTVLELGYDFVVTDVDIAWFRNPFPHFDSNSDIQVSCDRYNKGPFDMRNWPNVGFMLVRSNNRTIKFYDFWLSSRSKYPHLHEQDVLNVIKHGPFIKDIRLRIKYLDTTYFGGFCSPSRDFNKVCTMHANCCVGLHRKVVDLNTTIDDWMTYKSFPSNQTSHKFRWRVPNLCRMKKIRG